MKDRQAEILLQTPLLVVADREAIKQKPVLGHILKIIGKVVQENSGGVLVEVKSIGSDKALDRSPPWKEIFIPYHKIDHIVFA